MTEPITSPEPTIQDPAQNPQTPPVEPTPASTPDDDSMLIGPKDGDQPKGDEPKGDEPKGDEPKAGEPKGDEPKGDEPKGDEPNVPEKYEIKLEDGKVFDQETLDHFTPVLKELNLTNDQAQALSDKFVPFVENMKNKFQSDSLADYAKLAADWKKESLEALGQNAEEKLALGQKAAEQVGGEKFLQYLVESKMGVHPQMTQFLAKVGEMLKEDGLVPPSGENNNLTDDQKLDKLYPSMK